MPTVTPTPLLGPCACPRATARSARLRPAARTFTSTSFGFGLGCGMSRITSPFSLATPAFMLALPIRRIRSDMAMPFRSLDGDARRLGDIAPAAGLAGEERGEILRRADARLRAEAREQRGDVRRAQCLVDHLV